MFNFFLMFCVIFGAFCRTFSSCLCAVPFGLVLSDRCALNCSITKHTHHRNEICRNLM
uniref:Uncharacterized protein n=1 Tax=Anopheles arabiensis TaxID=7173 RepID=A0A182IFU6_ANOAR